MRHVFLGLAIAAFATGGIAQQKPATPVTAPTLDAKAAAKMQALRDEAARAAEGKAPKKDVKALPPKVGPSPTAITVSPADGNLSPEQLRAKYKGRLGAAYVGYTVTCKPARLAPGGSGKLEVMMVLTRDAVLLASETATVDMQPFQGKLALGTATFRPAGPARLAEAFRGKTAYDDYAILDIPVTVAGDAGNGPHAVKIGITYELYQGKTGGWIERFVDHVDAEVQVGIEPANAVAPVAGAAAAPAPSNGAAAAPPSADETIAAASPDHSAAVATDDGGPGLWLVSSGLVAALALMVWMRRRRG